MPISWLVHVPRFLLLFQGQTSAAAERTFFHSEEKAAFTVEGTELAAAAAG